MSKLYGITSDRKLAVAVYKRLEKKKEFVEEHMHSKP
jgi:hypothetical protein